MKHKRADLLVNRLAQVAGKAPEITAYVVLYQTKSGSICYHRDGGESTQLGMLEMMKNGVIRGMVDQEEE